MNEHRHTTAIRIMAFTVFAVVAAPWASACGGGGGDGAAATSSSTNVPTCSDGSKNGTETDVDCGGSCEKCVDGKRCAAPADCASGVCAGGMCEPDECAPSPCLNGGSCVDGRGSFTCRCAPGYTGATCEIDIDECAVKPCLNGGVCTDRVNGFTCECTADFGGATCSTDHPGCLALKKKKPATPDGEYLIDPDGDGGRPSFEVYCDMTTDGGGYTMFAVTGGISTRRYDEPNSCTAVGLQIAIPRTRAHLGVLFEKYGAAYFKTVPGVYGMAPGNFTGCAMTSTDARCAANWKALDGGAWFVRAIPYTEPSGDYIPGCWLGNKYNFIDEDGFAAFNDAGCTYATGPQYICSDNAK